MKLNGIHQLLSHFFFLFIVQVLVDGAPVRIQLWDTAGQVGPIKVKNICSCGSNAMLRMISEKKIMKIIQ